MILMGSPASRLGGIDHCTTCRDHSRPEYHDRVPEDDWEALSQPEKSTRSA
ncbi:Hypothetical protein FKW44_020663 [Caligus rogercresseyi]|uniref:Uncharacterized protein n=1 Tax=Caligus rogercresseyi TaxID=217165 RepID=A0A7T8GPY3_CALRO|nr:Hypothetical protein FKW44_020663 [Caligus rogercresseyi]